jgi:uncharacterized protein
MHGAPLRPGSAPGGANRPAPLLSADPSSYFPAVATISRVPGMTSIDTPCTRVCTLDPASGLCRGCGRTIDEIAGWRALAPAERRRIMSELPARLAGNGRAAARPA